MSVLDTFYFLFDADSSKLKKGLADADKNNKSVTDGLMKTDQVAEHLGESLKDLAKEAVSIVAGALALHALKDMVEQSAELTNQTRLAARAAFKGVEDYDAFAKATVAAGGSAEALGSTLHDLGMRTQTPINYLLRLSQVFKGLSLQRATRLASWIGIDPGLIPLLQKGEQGIKDIIKRQLELGVVTQEQADTAKAFKDQLRDTNTVFDDVKRRIATAILPYFTEFLHILERVTIWLRDHKEVVLGALGGIAAFLTAVYLPAMLEAALATLATVGPWLLIGAAVAAVAAIFGLLFDDVMHFLHGQNSVIGELAKKWPWIGELVKGVAESVGVLWDVMKGLFSFVVDIFTVGLAGAWARFKAKANAAIDAVGEKFPWLGALIRALAAPIAWVADVIISHWDEIKAGASDMWSVLSAIFQAIGAALQFVADLITEGPERAFHNLGVNTIAILEKLGQKFPWLAKVVNALKKPIMATAEAMGVAFKVFGDIVSTIVSWAIKAAEKVMAVVAKIRHFFSGDKNKNITVTGKIDGDTLAQGIAARDGSPERQKQLAEALSAGRTQLQATNTPINSVTSNAIANTTRSATKQTNVTVEEINIQTQSTDPDAINGAISSGLGDHIKGAIDQFSDGVAA